MNETIKIGDGTEVKPGDLVWVCDRSYSDIQISCRRVAPQSRAGWVELVYVDPLHRNSQLIDMVFSTQEAAYRFKWREIGKAFKSLEREYCAIEKIVTTRSFPPDKLLRWEDGGENGRYSARTYIVADKVWHLFRGTERLGDLEVSNGKYRWITGVGKTERCEPINRRRDRNAKEHIERMIRKLDRIEYARKRLTKVT